MPEEFQDNKRYFFADAENFKGTVNQLPTREEIDVPVDEMLIVELYSK